MAAVAVVAVAGDTYHPNRSLCNNDSNVNDGTAASIKTT